MTPTDVLPKGQQYYPYYETPKKEIAFHTFKHLIYNLKIYNGVEI